MINTLGMIKREMKNRHLNPSILSRKLGLSLSATQGMLKRPTLQVQRLADLSEIMQYNFFREIAQQFPYKQPVFDNEFKQKEAILTEEINTLKEENKALNIKLEVLNDVIGKLGK